MVKKQSGRETPLSYEEKRMRLQELELDLKREESANARAEALRAQEEQDNKMMDQELARASQYDVDLLKKKSSWFRASDVRTKFRRRFSSKNLVVCNFELMNGHHTTALLPVHKDAVRFKDGLYIIDDSLKYYHQGYKEYCFDFHEGFSMPVSRKIPLNSLNKAIQTLKIGNISYATNPLTLKTFQINEVVRSAIQAVGITDFFKQVRLLVIISALASVVMLILWAHKEGYFSGITG